MFYICLFRNYVINVQPLNIQRVKFLENSTNSQSYALQRSGKLPSNKEKLIFYNFCFTLTDISVSGVTLLAQMWFKMHGTIKVLYKVKSHSLLNAQNWIIRPTDGYDWRVWCPCHTPSKIGLKCATFVLQMSCCFNLLVLKHVYKLHLQHIYSTFVEHLQNIYSIW